MTKNLHENKSTKFINQVKTLQGIRKKEKYGDPSDLCAASGFASAIHTRLVFSGFPIRHNLKDGRQIIDQAKKSFPATIQDKYR